MNKSEETDIVYLADTYWNMMAGSKVFKILFQFKRNIGF